MDDDMEQHTGLLRARHGDEAQQVPDLQLLVPQERNISDVDLDLFTSGLDFMTNKQTYSGFHSKLHLPPGLRSQSPALSAIETLPQQGSQGLSESFPVASMPLQLPLSTVHEVGSPF